jgi:glutathione S-transferase
MTGNPILYGAPDSVYVRIVRMVLSHKNIDYALLPVDVFTDGGMPAEYLRLHPFGRIPAFVHNGFELYETSAITRYIDEAFDGAALQPIETKERARMNQIINILDAYCYRTLVWDIFVERVSHPHQNIACNEAKIAAAIPKAKLCLTALSTLQANNIFLISNVPTLADLHAAPMFAYFLKTQEGVDMLGQFPDLFRWWRDMSNLQCFTQTEF